MAFNWLEAVGLFFASFALDAIYVFYTVAVVKTKPLQAASWSFLSYVLLAIGVVSYVDNRWYVLPLALGAFAGAFAVLKWEELKNKRSIDKKG